MDDKKRARAGAFSALSSDMLMTMAIRLSHLENVPMEDQAEHLVGWFNDLVDQRGEADRIYNYYPPPTKEELMEMPSHWPIPPVTVGGDNNAS